MRNTLRNLFMQPRNQGLAWGVALVYLVIFLVAIGDLTLDGTARSPSLAVMSDWAGLWLRERAPFQFEAVAMVEAPFLVWLLSPANLAIGLALGLLTGLQIALVRVARRCSVACGLSPATGVLAGLPGLLTGSACCAPILFILLGIQVTAGLVTVMGLLIPAAFVLLLGGLLATLRVAARRCVQGDGAYS